MKKEVFTQEFEKCFTVFQQVQLIKKFLSELNIDKEIPVIDTSDKLSREKTFTDINGNTYNGLVDWSTENDTLSYETKIYSNVLQDFSTYLYMGNDDIIMDNHYAHIGIEKDTLDIHCDVGNKYSITGTVGDDNTTEINIKADRLLHNGEPIGGGGGSSSKLYKSVFTLIFTYEEVNLSAEMPTGLATMSIEYIGSEPISNINELNIVLNKYKELSLNNPSELDMSGFSPTTGTYISLGKNESGFIYRPDFSTTHLFTGADNGNLGLLNYETLETPTIPAGMGMIQNGYVIEL